MANIDIFLHAERPIEPLAVRELYASAGWWAERTEQRIAQVLEHNLAVGAWDHERQIGFARAISDGCFHAYIDDVVVHPDYQRQGIGQRMLSRLLGELNNIDTITLFCSPRLVPFYQSQGFQAFPRQTLLHRKRNAL